MHQQLTLNEEKQGCCCCCRIQPGEMQLLGYTPSDCTVPTTIPADPLLQPQAMATLSQGCWCCRIQPGEMELGLGIHGESGACKGPLKSADEIVTHVRGASYRYFFSAGSLLPLRNPYYACWHADPALGSFSAFHWNSFSIVVVVHKDDE